MPIAFEADRAVLSGMCGVDAAEPLLAWLSERVEARVDLSDCKHLHAAVLQVLLAARPEMVGEPEDAFVREHVLPCLKAEAPAQESE